MKVRFTPPPQSADVSRGIKVPYAPGKRKVVQWRWYVILALVVSPFAYLLFSLLYPVVVVTAPGFVHLEKEVLTAVAPGVVKTIFVHDGDRVGAEQPLVELFSSEIEDRLQALRQAVALAETGVRPEPVAPVDKDDSVLALYRRQEEEARRVVARQQQRVEVVNRLFAQGAATAAEVNALRVQLEGARHTLVQAQLDLKTAEREHLARQNPAPEPMTDRDRLREQLAELEARRQRLIIRATRDGIVLDTPVEIGRSVNPGEVMALIGVRSQAYVLAYLRPRLVKTVKPGGLATVSIPGGRSVEARVRQQPSQARRLPADLSSVIGARDIMVLVTLDLVSPLPTERAVEGLPVTVRFHRF